MNKSNTGTFSGATVSDYRKVPISSKRTLNPVIELATEALLDSELPPDNRVISAHLCPPEEAPEILLGDDSPSKTKRKPGEGNGTIEWRRTIKNGKEYPQAYYHWKEGTLKRSKYIPKKLLGLIQQAERQKRPVSEILTLLGVSNEEQQSSPSKTETPSKRRHKGEGTGQIHWKPYKHRGKGGIVKEYLQPWYHYELWQDGHCLKKGTAYIPKKLLGQVERLEEQKAPIMEILRLLGVK